MLKTTDAGVGDKEISDLVKQAVIEVNDPYVLAAQALLDDKLQPIQSETYDQLVALAKTAPVGADYDFSMIKAKLDNGRAKPADAKKDAAATDATADAARRLRPASRRGCGEAWHEQHAVAIRSS